MQCKRKLLSVLVSFAFLLSACSAELDDGIIELRSGYSILIVNSYQIILGHKEHPDQIGYNYAIDNYFITGYVIEEACIYLKGIPTADMYATVDEIKNGNPVFYVVNTTEMIIEGPFVSEDELINYLSTNSLPIMTAWIPIAPSNQVGK